MPPRPQYKTLPAGDKSLVRCVKRLRDYHGVRTHQQFADALGCALTTARRISGGQWPLNRGVQARLRELAHAAHVRLPE